MDFDFVLIDAGSGLGSGAAVLAAAAQRGGGRDHARADLGR